MEEYLQYMKTLRSQMNDVEDQAAKISVEEHTQIATIQTMETDLKSATSEVKKLKEDTDQMIQAKGQICSQILEKQRKIASLESDSYTLAQTLELIQQERVSLSAKLVEKSAYYIKVANDINAKLQQQQDWINSNSINREMGEQTLVKDNVDEEATETGGKSVIDNHLMLDNLGDDTRKNLMAKLDSAKAKLEEAVQMKSKLVKENSMVKQSIDQVRSKEKEFKPELLVMDIMTLEEEYKALLSDKDGEFEYLQSLQGQIGKLKGISHMIKCACGTEYKVAMEFCA
ncbi:hypothetical protein JCGZ_14828 [Jatropha curcas]|uniref:Uncharacterized protein n=1 Tax=Jatropha curcas TaxID=180498 RepID=A0A067K9A6_JATCU|nr:uncharacterized protein LOC105640093 [Jatropha curcas]KDP31603.1 hypothetical protein JCGZ_14828 [Jatropha curcas]